MESHARRVASDRIEGELNSRGAEPAGAGREAQPWLAVPAQGGAPPVHREREAAAHLAQLAAQQLASAQPALLHRRDLRLIEHIAHLDPIGRDRHRGEVIHGEVPEWVGGSRRGRQQHKNDGTQGCPDPHGRTSSSSRRAAGESAADPLTAAVR